MATGSSSKTASLNPAHLHTLPQFANTKGNSSSEVSSCNYEARQYGLYNGMFMGHAKSLCPDLVVLQYDFQQYIQVSEEIYKIFFRYMLFDYPT